MSSYVREIDGLRAVAVVAVLLFHVELGMFSGGYIGVDVFFVISGYLITRLILKDLYTGTFSLAVFFKRRILRIAPAFFAMLVGSCLLFFAIFPPALSQDLLPSLISALLSYSNLWLYLNVDYFGSETSNPVLHTWSLSTEEQFYLVFPICLILLKWSGNLRYASLVFAAALGTSLIASSIIVTKMQAAAFYLPFLRAWELLAGALLASMRFDNLPLVLRRAISDAGIVLIGAGLLLYSPKTLFPGVSALLPVLGAAAVIAGQGSPSLTNRLLSTAPMVWIGKASYSIYLVHWPIVCAVTMLLTLHSTKAKAVVLIASLMLGWLSWRSIEKPMRSLGSRVSTHATIGVFVASGIVLFAIFHIARLAGSAFWERFPAATRYAAMALQDTSYFRAGTCFLTPKYDSIDYFRSDECLAADDRKLNVLIMGDSHAANIVSGLAQQFPHLHFMQATASGCRPVLDVAGPERCAKLFHYIFRFWLAKQTSKVDYVVLAGRWEQSDSASIQRTVAYLRGKGKKVILYGPSPEYLIAVPLMLAYENVLGVNLHSRFLRQERIQLDTEFKQIFSGEVDYFSAVDRLCLNGHCVSGESDVSYFIDRDHFSPTGASKVLTGFPLPVAGNRHLVSKEP